MVVACYEVFQPFLSLMFWALILAVTLYPLHLRLRPYLGGNGRAASLIVLLVPAYLLGASLSESVEHGIALVKQDGLHLPPPPEAVAQWPLIGNSLYASWSKAAADLTSVLQQAAPHLKEPALELLGKMAGAGAGLLVFIGALVVAGIIMVHGDSGHGNARRIAARVVAHGHGEKLVKLCTATIRAVA